MEKVSFPQNSGLKRYTEATKKFVKGDPIDVLSGHIVEQRVDFTLGQTIPLSFIPRCRSFITSGLLFFFTTSGHFLFKFCTFLE
ncbi:hypothetical protein [Pasteurella sp. PK-2025]|uniref:hypothetical protein n=1 Tax=Pasteurella sp. PK-2025 TaxID=3413133 RepID=UPI003C70C23A